MIDKDIILAIACTTLLILLLIAVMIIVFVVSGRQRIRHEAQLTQAKLSFEQELRQVETEVSEQVTDRFARELHDNIGQLLTATHIQIENQKIDRPELAESFRPVEIYIGEISQQLRILSRTLNNDYLGHIGLLPAIQLEVERLEKLRRFRVHWQQPITGNSNLSKNQELMVFRIFQELTQNALRHSSAKNLFITINNNNGGFKLTTRDDGKGFDLNSTLGTARASGIKNIFKRAKLAGLECNIETIEGKGCSIALKKIT